MCTFFIVIPRVTVAPASTVSSVNGSAVLNCTSEGYPTPRLSWVHNGRRLSPENASLIAGNRLVNNNLPLAYLVLSLTSLNFSDAGSYTCVAENSLAEPIVVNRTAHLEVYCKYNIILHNYLVDAITICCIIYYKWIYYFDDRDSIAGLYTSHACMIGTLI